MSSKSDDFGTNVFNNMMNQFIKPEVEKRQKVGSIPTPFGLMEAQVLFPPDKNMVVRLNEEVKYVPSEEGIRLVDEELECGHMTLYLLNSKHSIAFDFRYFRDKSKERLEIANQFIESADQALKNGHFNALIDNLHSAYELISTAILVQLRKETKTHKSLKYSINQHMKAMVNFNKDFIKYFNTLQQLRPNARYLKSNLDDKQDFDNMIKTAKDAVKALDQNLK